MNIIIKSWDKNPKIIQLKSVDKKLEKYLKDYNADSLEELSLDQGNKFFIKVIKDFKEGKLSLDELSVFGGKIFHAIGKKNPKSDIFQASLSASELGFCTRSKEAFNNTPMFLSDVEEFFEKYEK
jgi:hypothetical protein